MNGKVMEIIASKFLLILNLAVDEKRFGRLSFAEEVQHMEALDVEHERLLQKRMQTLGTIHP
jgi:hypothetical protein